MKPIKFFFLSLTIFSLLFLASLTSCNKKEAETVKKNEKSKNQTTVEKPEATKPQTAQDVANQLKFMSDINNKDLKSGDDETIAKRLVMDPKEASENKLDVLLPATNELIRQYCECKKQTDSAKRQECDKNIANLYEQMINGLNEEQRAFFKYTFSRGTKNCN